MNGDLCEVDIDGGVAAFEGEAVARCSDSGDGYIDPSRIEVSAGVGDYAIVGGGSDWDGWSAEGAE